MALKGAKGSRALNPLRPKSSFRLGFKSGLMFGGCLGLVSYFRPGFRKVFGDG
jgi:hypothetical protein